MIDSHFLNLNLMCMRVLLACISVHHSIPGTEKKGGIRSSESGVTDGYEQPWCARN